jgi:hypothetical protein
MPSILKAGIVVLAVAALIFRFAKPVALQFTAEADFVRRRNIWLILTAAAFLLPNFWLFALVAVPLLIWGGRKDDNPLALYLLLLQVVPQIPLELPTIGIGSLLAIDMYRLLALFLLIPAARRLRRARDSEAIKGVTTVDVLIIGWGLVQLLFFVPADMPGAAMQESITGMLRRAVIYGIDICVLYYVASRCCANRRAIVEAMAAYCLAGAIYAALAVIESARHWLLYGDLYPLWTGHQWQDLYLFRGGSLRVQVSAGHSIALGYLLAMALGFWLYLQAHVTSKKMRIAVPVLLWAGLLATYSRGPWLGAICVYFFYAALGPRAFSRLIKAGLLAGGTLAALSATPVGDKVLRVLPIFGGSVDAGSITYRQMLAARSWQLIMASPFFGDQLAFFKMEDLRQGEGIIDLVNTYAAVALFHGFIGLALFVGFILIPLNRARLVIRANARTDADMSRLGAALGACILSTLVMLATCSFILSLEKMYYVLGGLTAAYAYLGRRRPAESTQPVAAR